MLVSSHACIFCQAIAPGAEITQEHVWSDWVNDVLTRDVVGTGLRITRTLIGPGERREQRDWPTKKPASVKVGAVCNTCNSGWMSDLEGIVIPLLKPAILGEATDLSIEEQLSVATWATTKSMAFEYTWPEPAVCCPRITGPTSSSCRAGWAVR